MMNKRKILLLATIAVLLCIYIVQVVGAHRSPVKAFTLAETPDAIVITSAVNGTVSLSYENDAWVTGAEKAPAEENLPVRLTNALQSLKTLGTVSRSNSDADLQRYGLDDQNKITVVASKNGKTLRSLVIGKSATNAAQTYVRVDGASETLIASGDLHSTFDITEEDTLAEKEPEESQQ